MPSSSAARVSRQKLASVPPISLADRWPHVIEMENNNVHNSAANTGRTLAGLGPPVENGAARVDSALRQAKGRRMRKPHRGTALSARFLIPLTPQAGGLPPVGGASSFL